MKPLMVVVVLAATMTLSPVQAETLTMQSYLSFIPAAVGRQWSALDRACANAHWWRAETRIQRAGGDSRFDISE